MNKKIVAFTVIVIFVMGLFTANAQNKKDIERLNNYEYVIIPVQFSFQKKENEYRINSQLKHLLKEESITTYMDSDSYPEDLSLNRCLALYAEVKNLSEGFFSTHTAVKIRFRNCKNEIVYETATGSSRKKDYGEGFRAAIKDAFISFNNYYYKYNGNEGMEKEDAETAETEEKKTENPLSQTLGNEYVYEGESYEVNKINAGYLLMNKDKDERVALLNVTEDGNVLYNSDKVNGTASIKENGKTIQVEYYDTEEDELRKVIYEMK